MSTAGCCYTDPVKSRSITPSLKFNILEFGQKDRLYGVGTKKIVVERLANILYASTIRHKREAQKLVRFKDAHE